MTTSEPTKQRTRSHIIASQSLNHVERFIYDGGHSVERVQGDYGYDLLVSTYNLSGYVEPGFIPVQVKATDAIEKIRNDSFVNFRVSAKDYRLWMDEYYPVFLIVYDAIARKAYWLYFQQYFEKDSTLKPHASAQTMTLRIPLGNELSEETVEYMRVQKAARITQFSRVHRDD